MRNRADKKLRTDRRTDGLTDRQTDSYIPPKQSFGGIINTECVGVYRLINEDLHEIKFNALPNNSDFIYHGENGEDADNQVFLLLLNRSGTNRFWPIRLSVRPFVRLFVRINLHIDHIF